MTEPIFYILGVIAIVVYLLWIRKEGEEKYRKNVLRDIYEIPLREYLDELATILKKYPDPELQEIYNRALPFAYLHLKEEIEKLQKGLGSGTMTLRQFQRHLKELTKNY